MTIIKIEYIKRKKILLLKCDWCNKNFSRNINVPRSLKAKIHFCNNTCSGKYKFVNLENVNKKGLLNLTEHFDKLKFDEQYFKKINNKREQTNIIKYGTKTPLENKDIQKKCNETLIKKYGVDNPGKSNIILEKIKKTNLEKYGNEFQIASTKTRKKIEKIFVDKYNSKTPANKIKKIKETNEYVIEWFNKQPEPKPLRNQIYRTFTKDLITLDELENFISSWRTNKTNLEFLIENLFNVTFYNKKPNNLKNKFYKPDFKLSDNIYLNVDGLYWHSEKFKNKKYHFNLRNFFEINDLRIFQFRENEIKHKPEIIKSIVDNSLKKINKKIYARNCFVKQISQKEATEFLNKTHLMGSITAKHFGLYTKNDNKLISIMSYKTKNNICKIERFCSILNTSIIGGFSKLLKHIENNLKSTVSQIYNWVDLRYGTGKHLSQKGFYEARTTLGWHWTDGHEIYNRLRCRANMDERKLTEKEHADERGWYKIYDAGQRLFIKQL